MPRKIEHKWFRSWAEEEIGKTDPDGFNAYKEFGPQEHWCWFGLRCLCASTEMQPVVCVTPYVGYTDRQFAEFFKVDTRVWEVVKKKLEIAKKIEVDGQNVIRIVNWERYAGRYFQAKKNRDLEMRLWTEADDQREKEKKREKAEIFKRVIIYLNETSHKHFRTGSPDAFHHVSARIEEGATEKDFRHVIDVKCGQWIGTEMEKFIRPQTLFNSEKFWGYANEPDPRPQRPPIGAASTILPDERKKYEAQAKAEYEERLKRAMETYGWKTVEEIPSDAYFKGIPSFEEFFVIFLKEKKRAGEWNLNDDE